MAASRPEKMVQRSSACGVDETEISAWRTGARVFHFDVGDGHFVEPITMGPIVLQAIAPVVHAAGGVMDCHLMVDNPTRHFPQIASSGGNSVTFHYEAVDDVPGDDRRRARARPLRRRRVQPRDRAGGRRGGGVRCRSRPLHEHPPGIQRPGVHARTRSDGSSGSARCCRTHIHVQVDGGVDNDNVRSIYDAGATLIVAGAAIFSREDLPRAYRRMVQALA